jgi:hypothetical protein
MGSMNDSVISCVAKGSAGSLTAGRGVVTFEPLHAIKATESVAASNRGVLFMSII